MNQTIAEENKVLVLKAFDTLFNQRDYAAAERYWSPHYIQHSAHIEPGREGLFDLIKSLPPTLKYEPGVILGRRRIRGMMSGTAEFRVVLTMRGPVVFAAKTEGKAYENQK